MPEDGDESASSLRSKLSESHGVAATATARAVIAEKGLSHVTVEDLKGAKLDEIESRAISLNEQRESAGMDALKKMLSDKGVEDVDAAMSEFLEGSPAKSAKVDSDAIGRARQVGASGGPVVSEDLSHIKDDGAAQIRWALENEK